MENSKILVDVHERPALQKWIPLSLQHLFAMFGATVLVPIITGLDISVALFSSGLGTLLFLFLTKGQVPNYLGSSFAFIGPIIAVSASQGVGAAMLGALLAGLVYVIVALIVKKIGIAWLDRLLPPAVIGAVISVIGLALAGVSIGWAMNDPMITDRSVYTLHAMEVSLVTLIIVVGTMMFARGFFSVIPVLVGIIGGYIYAFIRYPEWIDLEAIRAASWFKVPDFTTSELFTAFGSPDAWLAALIIVPVALVTLTEHIGHLLVTSEVMGRDLMKKPGLTRTLLGDGLATTLAAFVGGPPNTTYGENIGVLAITRVFSTKVIGLAAVFAITFSFIEKIGVALALIPKPVLGGVTIVLFGTIAAQGVRMFVEHGVDISHKRNMLVIAVIFITGIGGYKLDFAELSSVSDFIAHLTVDNIAMATFLGIILHAILPDKAVAYGTRKQEKAMENK
ncbi:uracil-xanthine permease family protein [Rubeoparvulum massiliense]|uniref:uracil-xanthine permease family protein n=1 Tax=Rubeoparvulum massiliense TaxID=1631346 RepID=UPI00065E788F|nr:solute carrier family 23 protein [Rubeoparvulum massiliense]